MSSSLINVIAIHATAEEAAPTAPSLNSNVSDWATPAFTTIGSIQRSSHAVDLDEESVSIGFLQNIEEILPPRSLTREDIIMLQNGVNDFAFTCYDGSSTLLDLASDMATTSAKTEVATSLTFRTVIIEVNGLWMEYFPKCAVFIQSLGEGYGSGGQAKTEVRVLPIATSSIKGGWQRINYV